MNIPNKNELTRIYGEAENSAARFQAVADHFAEIYHHDTAEFFTAPGRTEIIGALSVSQVKDMTKKLS